MLTEGCEYRDRADHSYRTVLLPDGGRSPAYNGIAQCDLRQRIVLVRINTGHRSGANINCERGSANARLEP